MVSINISYRKLFSLGNARDLYSHISSIWGQLKLNLRRIVTSPEVIAWACATGSGITRNAVTGNDVAGTGNDREIISRVFIRISRVFSEPL